MLNGTRILEVHLARSPVPVSVQYAGKLLHLLGARVDIVEVNARDDEADGEDKEFLRHETFEAFLPMGKNRRVAEGSTRPSPRELVSIAQSMNCGAILVGSDGDRRGQPLRRVLSALREVGKPAQVICITPFGLEGPKAGWQGSNLVALAAGGAAYYTPGWCQDLEADRPLQLSQYGADLLAGAVATAAAIAQLTRGSGDAAALLDVSVHDCVLSMMLLNFAWVTHENRVPSRSASANRGVPLIPLRCRDGLFSLLTPQQEQWERWVAVMGSPAWAEEPIFATRALRTENWDVLRRLIEEWASDYTKEEVWRMGQAAEVPVFPVNTVSEVMAASQMRARRFFEPAPLGTSGSNVLVPGNVFKHVHPVAKPAEQRGER